MKLKQFVGVFAMVILMAMPVASANELVTTDPASGSTVLVSPSAVTIITSMPLMAEGNSVEVTDPSGKRVDDGTLAIADTEALVGLTPLTVGGYYTVSYTLLAENDVPLEGSFRFTFAAPSEITTPQPIPVESTSAKAEVNDWGTNAFVIGLLVVAFFVLVLLSLYARKIYRER